MEKAKEEGLKEKASEYAEVVGLGGVEDIRKIVELCYIWSGQGKKVGEIVKDLRMSSKQFKELQGLYPEIIGAIKNGKEYANLLLSMSAQEMAIGKYWIEREVVVMEVVSEYDERGKKVGERKVPKVMVIKEQQKADAGMLKFMLTNKMPEAYGKSVVESSEARVQKELNHMDEGTKKMVYEEIKRRKTISGSGD